MAISFFSSGLRTAAQNPYGNYLVSETGNGIRFQVTTHHPGNLRFGAALALKSLGLAAVLHAGFWNFLGVLVLLLALDVLFYLGLRRVRLSWVEVRPDGFTITPDAARP